MDLLIMLRAMVCQVPSIPHRYLVAVMAALCSSLTNGTRTAFTLVMTHLTSPSQSTATNFLFQQCRVHNSSSDLRVEMGTDAILHIQTAYFVSFAVMMVPASFLSSSLSAKLMLGMVTGLVSMLSFMLPSMILYSTPGLTLLRMLQGAMEGIRHPTLVAIVATWATAADKSKLYGIFALGAYLSPALGSGLTAVFLCYVSWDGIFYLYGGAGAVWVVVWWRWFHSSPQSRHLSLNKADPPLHNFPPGGNAVHPSRSPLLKNVPWLSIIRSRGVWAVFIGIFTGNAVFSMLLTQEPQYFLDAFQFKVADIGVLSMVPFMALAMASIVGGVVSDYLIRTGMALTTVRKTVYSAAYTVQGMCLMALHWVSDWRTAFVIICCGIPFGGFAVVAYNSLPSDMAPQFTASIFGLALLGTVGSAASTAAASLIAGTTATLRSWQTIFLILGVWDIISVLLFNVTADATRQPWAEVTLTRPSANDNDGDSIDGSSSGSVSEDDSISALLTAEHVSEKYVHQLDNTNDLNEYETFSRVL